MRKITEQACHAFVNGREYRNGNTTVRDYTKYSRDTVMVYELHGNMIAKIDSDMQLHITLAGWNSNTTRERLNGLPGVRVTTKQGQAYLNGEPWDGEWVAVA